MSGNPGSYVEQYTRRFTSFSGADIQAIFNGRVIGELQQITISVRREKGPVYTVGSANPRCFARGKRGIAGTMVFTQFDRDALIEEMAKVQIRQYQSPLLPVWASEMDSATGGSRLIREYKGMADWDREMSEAAGSTIDPAGGIAEDGLRGMVRYIHPEDFEYSDQLFPFDVTIFLKNDYGVASSFHVLGVELLNESFSLGIDDLALERVYTYIALGLRRMRPFDTGGRRIFGETESGAGIVDRERVGGGATGMHDMLF